MCRLRQGLPEEHLAHLFKVSLPTVSRVFITWLNFMYLRLGQINIWPSRTAIDKTMPEDFKKKNSSTRVINDCTEVRCQMPSSLQLNGELFSNYKHHTTLKGLIGISPGGAITFISQRYTHFRSGDSCDKWFPWFAFWRQWLSHSRQRVHHSRSVTNGSFFQHSPFSRKF